MSDQIGYSIVSSEGISVEDKQASSKDVENRGVDFNDTATSLNPSQHEKSMEFDGRPRESSASSQHNQRNRAPTFSPVAPDQSPTVLSFTNITVRTRNKPKKILLDNVSGSITGGFWAIMGASGGGKTTLLSTLSLRLDTNYMEIHGEFRLNGREYSRHMLKAMSAYVMQDDLLHAELTVQETLSYAAQLRMAAPGTTSTLRDRRIDEVLELMGISHIRNVIIGNSRKKGISGGERKRVSVAVELLNKPKLMFLDEPTSGLDSNTALSVCTALKNLTVVGECTVVCTIHQPQPKIFYLFDNLILMKKGAIIFQGSVMKVGNFLTHLGFPCPEDVSVADYVIEVISPSRTDADEALKEKRMIPPVNLSLGMEKPLYTQEGARNWLDQFFILFRRNYRQYIRNTDIILMNALVTVLLAVFIGSGLWFQIGTGQDSIAKRVPALFFTCVTQGIVGSLQAINSFPSERAIMLRERQAGTYQVSAYFAAKSATDTLSQLWPPVLFSVIVYWLIGFQPVASKFFMYTFFMVLDCLTATSLATVVTCFCVSVEMSTVVLCCLFEICRLFGGFFASPTLMEEEEAWAFADALSYIKYAFVGSAITELQGLKLSCDPGETCQYTTGEEIMKDNGYTDYSVGYCVGILFVFIVGFRLLAYLGLRYIKI
eukprot:gene31507-38079_t